MLLWISLSLNKYNTMLSVDSLHSLILLLSRYAHENSMIGLILYQSYTLLQIVCSREWTCWEIQSTRMTVINVIKHFNWFYMFLKHICSSAWHHLRSRCGLWDIFMECGHSFLQLQQPLLWSRSQRIREHTPYRTPSHLRATELAQINYRSITAHYRSITDQLDYICGEWNIM